MRSLPCRLAFACMALGSAACGRLAFEPVGANDDSLIAHYRFDDDPIDGAEDDLGRGPATCVDRCPTRVEGPRGGAYKFDGVSEALATPLLPELSDPDGSTAAAWVRLDATPSGPVRCVISKPLLSTKYNSYQLCVGGSLGAYLGGTSAGASSAPVFSIGVWYHVAVVATPTMLRAYVNGALVGELPSTLLYEDAPVLIGFDLDLGVVGNYFEGAVDDVRLYDRVLEPEDIATIAGL